MQQSRNINLSSLAIEIWNASEKINFGNESKDWNSESFKKSWFSSNNIKHNLCNTSPGWYWFSVNMTYEEIQKLKKPNTLPTYGCDFGSISQENIKTFTPKLLCNHRFDRVVIYNGHESKVKDRIRAHFNLNNNRTGALGIKHYNLSKKLWRVNYFTEKQIEKLPYSIQKKVKLLINNKYGRTSIETAWRANFGWPILCKI